MLVIDAAGTTIRNHSSKAWKEKRFTGRWGNTTDLLRFTFLQAHPYKIQIHNSKK
jgi:hypothetical protein